MSLPFEADNGSNNNYVYRPENNVNTSISSHCGKEEVCDTIILVMLIWIIIILWRKSEWQKLIVLVECYMIVMNKAYVCCFCFF